MLINTRQSSGFESTRSPSNARAKNQTVDRVSGHGRSSFDRVFGDRGVTRGHRKVFQSRSDGQSSCDNGNIAHDHRAIVAIDWSSPNRTVRDFRRLFE